MNSDTHIATKDPVFALEQILPGTFVLQGILGGLLGGFIYVCAQTVWSLTPEFQETLLALPLALFVWAIIGANEAAILWYIYQVSYLRLSAGMRVTLVINGFGVIGILLLRFGELWTMQSFPTCMVAGLLSAVPTALLVGSLVRPWELFTFGSIAVYQNDVRRREGSKSLAATLGTLPLRFLSLSVLALWILKFSCDRKFNMDWISTALMFGTPAVYPALSAYVTFRSPRKWNLLIIGIAVNLPYGLISTAAFANNSNTSWLSELPVNVNFTCLAFTLAWALFLIARLRAQTSDLVQTRRFTSELMRTGRSHKKPRNSLLNLA